MSTYQQDIDSLKPDSFCLRINDFGVACGPTGIETTLVFKNEKEALEYLIKELIPATLEYIDDSEIVNQSSKFVKNIENIVKNPIKDTDMRKAIDDFNKLFTEGIEVQVQAYGRLNEYLFSKHIKDLIKESKEDFEEKEHNELSNLVNSKTFDSKNQNHLEIAKHCLKNMEVL